MQLGARKATAKLVAVAPRRNTSDMTQSLKVVAVVAAALCALSACSEVRTQAFEGQGCSRSTSMSPYYACDQSRVDLICIATYTVGERMTDAYVCRLACTNNSDCPSATDVCCAGDVVANPFSATKACVPRAKCQTDPSALITPDGGAADARVDSGNPTTSGPDAMSDEAGEDASTDAGADAAEQL